MTDIDNRIKSVLDALQIAGAFENDSQVDELSVSRGSILRGGRIEVLIGEIEAP
jgi:crossover junction endodeoxyribonuclease RusA